MGVNSIYSKACLLKINGYDEQYDYYLDQTDLCARLVDAGYYINYQEGADVYHKFSPSHLRDKNKYITNYTPIIKNLYYYIHQYKPFFSEDYIEKEFFKSYNNVLNQNDYLYKNNTITKEDYIKAKDSIEEGVKEGKKSVARGYKLLMTQETLTKYKSDYKQFPTFFQSDLSKKRTIVFLAPYYEKNLYGTSTLIYNLAYNMAKKGHNIHIFTVLHSIQSASVTYEDGIWLHQFPLNSYSYDFLRSKTPYDIHMVENTNYIDLCICYTIYEEVLKLSNKYKIDIIQDFIWTSLNFYLLSNEQFTSITCIVTPVTYHFKNNSFGKQNIDRYETMQSSLEEYCVLNNNNIISDSVAIKYLFKDYFNYQGEPELIYLGLEDLSKEKFENNLVKDNSKIEILFLSPLWHRKGIDLLYAVIPAICEKYPNVIFRIVGNKLVPSHIDSSKTYTEIFLQENEHLVQKGQVIIEGKVKDKLPYYQNCDIFIAPSRYESFGFTVVEAMIFSKPTIGNNAGAIPEVIEDNVTGLLFEKDNTDSLKNVIIKLIESKDLREKMGIAGRKRYEKLFTAELMSENYLKYYEKVLKNKKETE
jgi:glycosyltransferase involved in cell wall biosynthesis